MLNLKKTVIMNIDSNILVPGGVLIILATLAILKSRGILIDRKITQIFCLILLVAYFAWIFFSKGIEEFCRALFLCIVFWIAYTKLYK